MYTFWLLLLPQCFQFMFCYIANVGKAKNEKSYKKIPYTLEYRLRERVQFAYENKTASHLVLGNGVFLFTQYVLNPTQHALKFIRFPASIFIIPSRMEANKKLIAVRGELAWVYGTHRHISWTGSGNLNLFFIMWLRKIRGNFSNNLNGFIQRYAICWNWLTFSHFSSLKYSCNLEN